MFQVPPSVWKQCPEEFSLELPCALPGQHLYCPPTERHVQTWYREAQVVVPEGLRDLQCPSSFCAGPETDSSTKGCRGPWGAAGQAPNTWTWWRSEDR